MLPFLFFEDWLLLPDLVDVAERLLLDEPFLFDEFFAEELLLLFEELLLPVLFPLEELLLLSEPDPFSEPWREDTLLDEEERVLLALLRPPEVLADRLSSISVAASASRLMRPVASFVSRSSAWYSSFSVCSSKRATSSSCNSLAYVLAVP